MKEGAQKARTVTFRPSNGTKTRAVFFALGGGGAENLLHSAQ